MRLATRRKAAARVYLTADQNGNAAGSFVKVNLNGVEYVRGASGILAPANGGLVAVEAGMYQVIGQLSASGMTGTIQYRLTSTVGGTRAALQAAVAVAEVMGSWWLQAGETVALEAISGSSVWNALSGAANTWMSGERID